MTDRQRKQRQLWMNYFNYIPWEEKHSTSCCLHILFNTLPCRTWYGNSSCMYAKYLDCQNKPRMVDHLHWYAKKDKPDTPVALTFQPYGLDKKEVKKLKKLEEINIKVKIDKTKSWWYKNTNMVHIIKTPKSKPIISNDPHGVYTYEKFDLYSIEMAIKYSADMIRAGNPLHDDFSLGTEVTDACVIEELFGAIISGERLYNALQKYMEEELNEQEKDKFMEWFYNNI